MVSLAHLDLRLRHMRHGACPATKWCDAHHQQVILWQHTRSKASLITPIDICTLTVYTASGKIPSPTSTTPLVALHACIVPQSPLVPTILKKRHIAHPEPNTISSFPHAWQ